MLKNQKEKGKEQGHLAKRREDSTGAEGKTGFSRGRLGR